MSRDTPTTPAPPFTAERIERAEHALRQAFADFNDPDDEDLNRLFMTCADIMAFAASLKRREEQRDEELRGFIQEASLLSVRMANSMMTPERLRELLSMPEKPTEAP